jgi:hypothetical protein
MNQDYSTNASNQRILLNQYDHLGQYHQHSLAHLHLLLPPSSQTVVGSSNNQYQQALNYAAAQSNINKKDQSVQPIVNNLNLNCSPNVKKNNPLSTNNAQQQQSIAPSSYYPNINSNPNSVQSYHNHYGYQHLANQFSQYSSLQQDISITSTSNNNNNNNNSQSQQLNQYENNLIRSYENLKSTSTSPSSKLSKSNFNFIFFFKIISLFLIPMRNI